MSEALPNDAPPGVGLIAGLRERWRRVTGGIAQVFGRNERLRVRSGMILSVVFHVALVSVCLVTLREATGGPGGMIEVSFESLGEAGLEGESEDPLEDTEAAADAMDPELTKQPQQDPNIDEGLDQLVDDVTARERERAIDAIEAREAEDLESLARRVKDRASADRLRGDRLADLERKLANVKVGYRGEIFGTVESRKVVFCIDISGSMQGDKIALTKRELVRVIQERLPDGASFEIITFASVVSRWNGTLAPADADHKRKAEEWVKNLQANGGTSAFQALREAFSMQDAEAIYLLSDGQPTDGRGDDIRAWVRQANKDRGVIVNTIGFLVGPPQFQQMFTEAERFLAGLAEDNNGIFRAIR